MYILTKIKICNHFIEARMDQNHSSAIARALAPIENERLCFWSVVSHYSSNFFRNEPSSCETGIFFAALRWKFWTKVGLSSNAYVRNYHEQEYCGVLESLALI